MYLTNKIVAMIKLLRTLLIHFCLNLHKVLNVVCQITFNSYCISFTFLSSPYRILNHGFDCINDSFLISIDLIREVLTSIKVNYWICQEPKIVLDTSKQFSRSENLWTHIKKFLAYIIHKFVFADGYKHRQVCFFNWFHQRRFFEVFIFVQIIEEV